jgi:hypothetical protein
MTESDVRREPMGLGEDPRLALPAFNRGKACGSPLALDQDTHTTSCCICVRVQARAPTLPTSDERGQRSD